MKRPVQGFRLSRLWSHMPLIHESVWLLTIRRIILTTRHQNQDFNISSFHKSVLTSHFQFMSIGCCNISVLEIAVQCFDPAQSSLLNIRSTWRSLFPLKASTHVRDEEVESDGATTIEMTSGKTLRVSCNGVIATHMAQLATWLTYHLPVALLAK